MFRTANSKILKMTASRIIAIILLIGVTVLLGFAIYVNIDNIAGAFGDGPPYYGRTTNMDKWGNPIPFLVIFDFVVAGVSYFIIRWGLSKLRNR